ncbi:hypothetical protein MTP99_012489 [Tenebrio molitor]|nr:hypothetical protein MTP99_012489 [Tenebrio molitor]
MGANRGNKGANNGFIVGGRCGNRAGSNKGPNSGSSPAKILKSPSTGSSGAIGPNTGNSNNGRASWPSNGNSGFKGASNGCSGASLSNSGANLGNNLVTIGFRGGGKCGKRAGSKIRITSGLRNFKNESSGANNKGTNSCPSRGNKGAKGVKSGCSGASGANKGARMGSKGANKGCIVFGKCGNKIGSRSGPSTGIIGPSNSTNGKISTGPRGPKSSISAGTICGNNNKTGSKLRSKRLFPSVLLVKLVLQSRLGAEFNGAAQTDVEKGSVNCCSSRLDEFCEEFPHNFIPTPGYWIECSRQKITSDTIWDESESDHEIQEGDEEDHTDGTDQENGHPSRRRDRSCNDLYEDDEEDDSSSPRKKTTIEEQWEKNQGFELTSVEQETYEKYFYGTEHWNYFTNDEDLGPVILSIKQETLNSRDQFRILVRAISYTVHGLIPASCVFADRYNREEVVRSLGKEVNINPPLTLGQLPDTPEELLKLDQVFIKSELKVGVIYVKEGQYTEEEILDNNDNSLLFEEFLQIFGEKVRLKGFDKYKGGLDTVHDLTGLYSVYTNWRNIEIMFHVSTLLPYEKHDPQKLQRKRHIGNDIVCVVFLEADNTSFSPACIKSHFLHTFILVRTSPRIKRKPTRYEVSVVTRDEVGAYKPYLWEQSVFDKGPMFREWLLTKIVNGERASYSAPKFARMQERTRSQMLEDIVANLQNHAETGQIPKPYRRGSWRPIGHMRPSSPLLDSVRDQFEDYDQIAKDFTRMFLNTEANTLANAQLFDVVFLVGQSKQKAKLVGVRAILGVRSRVFQEMLYGIQTGFGSPQVPVAELLARPVPTLLSPQQSRPKSSNFLQVPDIESPRPKSVPSSPMVKRAFSRLGTITAGWGRSIRKHNAQQLSAEDKKKWASSQDCSNKEGKDKEGKDKPTAAQLPVPRLSVCADAQKVDRAKLAQTEFSIIEFDPDTFRILLDYLHTGSCPLTCSTIPGLICAAEHYDLPELLQACFHHAKQFLRIEVVCCMLCSLENYYWRYTSASELVNMILAFVETRAYALFTTTEFLTLSESMVQMIMCRNLEVPEVRKFEAMLAWARHKIRTKTSSKLDAKLEFKCIMERLARDLKLYRISPQELIKVVLPSKAIKNERILETLMFQANSGMYRIQDSYIKECTQRLQKQDSRFSEWESFDYST